LRVNYTATEQVLYVNKYYEKNLTTGEITTYYYLGGRRVAMSKDTDLRYIHQDHITSTAVMTSANGTQVGSMKYYPYGDRLESQGTLSTDRLFTGQRLDDTGLYYYGARYYDPTIGRFISADSLVQSLDNPQFFNRYAYVLNNPLKYKDPSGRQLVEGIGKLLDEYGITPSGGEIAIEINISQIVEVAKDVRGAVEHAPTIIAEKVLTNEKVAQTLGIEKVEHTQIDRMEIPVPVYHVSDQGIIRNLLGENRGISVCPIGTFIKREWVSPEYIKHESYHFREQSEWGMGNWVPAYFAEIGARSVYYGSRYWGYYTSSFEHRAREYAEQPDDPAPDPWWQPYWDDLNTPSYSDFIDPTDAYFMFS
jgi:RHS repeat-associated protein